MDHFTVLWAFMLFCSINQFIGVFTQRIQVHSLMTSSAWYFTYTLICLDYSWITCTNIGESWSGNAFPNRATLLPMYLAPFPFMILFWNLLLFKNSCCFCLCCRNEMVWHPHAMRKCKKMVEKEDRRIEGRMTRTSNHNFHSWYRYGWLHLWALAFHHYS